MESNYAKVNVTWMRQNGYLNDLVLFDSSDESIRQMVKEAVASGSVDGIQKDENADFTDFVIERFEPSGDNPARIVVRSKTPFGL